MRRKVKKGGLRDSIGGGNLTPGAALYLVLLWRDAHLACTATRTHQLYKLRDLFDPNESRGIVRQTPRALQIYC